MTYVVTEPCFDCKYTDCCVVCPVECFYQDAQMLYIDPDDCVDCDKCAPECPVEAIFKEEETPQQWISYVQLNADRSAALKAAEELPIKDKQDPLEGPKCRKKA
jgi:ferredoxin